MRLSTPRGFWLPISQTWSSLLIDSQNMLSWVEKHNVGSSWHFIFISFRRQTMTHKWWESTSRLIVCLPPDLRLLSPHFVFVSHVLQVWAWRRHLTITHCSYSTLLHNCSTEKKQPQHNGTVVTQQRGLLFSLRSTESCGQLSVKVSHHSDEERLLKIELARQNHAGTID